MAQPSCVISGAGAGLRPALRAIGGAIALRVDAEGETDGLDLALHDERGYNL